MDASILPQVVTGLFTLFAAFGGALTQSFVSNSRKRKSVRRALLTEVASIVSIIDRRGYRQGIVDRTEGESSTFVVRIPDNYRIVYDSLIVDIGLLKPDEAQDLVSFYMLILAVVEDIRLGGPFSDVETATNEAYREALGILDQALEIGHRLINRR